MPIARPNAHDRLIRLPISRLDRLEPLREPHNDIARFRRHEDVRRADSRPAPKRDKLPHGSDVLPAFRAELFGALAPNVRVPVHQVSVAVDDVALLDKDGGLAVGTAADGQGGVSESDANHLDPVGVQAVS